MLYDIGFLLFSLIYLPALLFKGKLHRDFLQRFGMYDKKTVDFFSTTNGKIWIQAVSVGEVALCKIFIPLLKNRYPHRDIVLSTITKAGYELAKKSFQQSATVIYFPLDFTFVVRKVAALIRPKMYIMIETEIWPNLISELSRSGVACVIINGRISDRSYGKYLFARPFLKKTLGKIMLYCMRSEVDAKRIVEMGAPKNRVKVTGNMKFDIDVALKSTSTYNLKEMIALEDTEKLIVAGSTHRGEEEMAIEVFRELVKDFASLKLLIAPRHINRVAEVEKAVKKFGFESARVSHIAEPQSQTVRPPIYILDTIGHLNDAYSISSLVFIGGSLVKHGGHNPIEPAVFEKPILFGPHMHNFKDTSLVFLRNNGAIQVTDKADLYEKARLLLRDDKERAWLGRNAKRAVAENRGATERNLNAIRELHK